MKPNKILILSPHTDDAELGCGGSIARWKEEGKEVYLAVFSTAEESVPQGMPPDTLQKEFYQSMETFAIPRSNLFVYHYPVRKLSYHRQEVLEELVKLRRTVKPDLIIIPSGNDLHQDHQVVHMEGLRAFKDMSIMAYELPWNHIHFTVQGFIALEERHIAKKIEALKSYRSQIDISRPYFTPEFILALAKVRGTQINKPFAEVYEILRIEL